jgi:uncharacterized protein YjdB
LLCLLLTGNAFATDWYVSPKGHDRVNTGRSADSPFRTIQKAANAARSGDVVNVMAGTYREQVDVKTGVTFQPNGSDVVTLNGTEMLTGWTLESGSTYKTSAMKWDVNPLYGTNQLFQDKTMIELLRWPKQTSADIIMPTTGRAESVVKTGDNYVTLTDPKFNEGDGRWNGAKIWINLSRNGHDGQGWTGDVVSTSGNTITIDFRSEPRFGDRPWGFGPGQEYFLYDPTPKGVAIASIDKMLGEGEWWKDTTTNIVYVKTRDGQAPSTTGAGSRVIEAKKRHFGFWSSTEDKNSYTIRGFKFFACSFTTVPDAKVFIATEEGKVPGKKKIAQNVTNVLLENLDFTYPSHQTEMRGNWQLEFAGYSGVVLNGINNTIQNCKIRFTATSALSIQGENIKVLNNEIESTNYFSANSGTINCGWWVRDAVIGHNKIGNTSHMVINLHGSKNSNVNNRYQMRVHHNRIWDFMRRNDDGGAIDHSFLDGQWIRIDHNTIFQSGIDEETDVTRFQKSAIYMDYGQLGPVPNLLGNVTIDHNVMYNVQNAILLSEIRNVNIFNNVMLIDEYRGKKTTIEGHTGETWPGGVTSFGAGVKIINNIMSHPPNRDPYDPFSQFRLVEYHNNILNASKGSAILASLFEDPNNSNLHARNYQLKANSPAIDKGVKMGIYNDDSIEEPDLGAYERGTDGNNSGGDTTPPAQPAEPTVSNTLELSFSLSWAPSPDVGGGVAYYELSTEPGTEELHTRYTDVPNITVGGLISSTDYTFNLVAVDGMGNRSQPRQFSVRSGDQIADVRLPKTTTAPALDGIREAGVYTLAELPINVFGEGSLPLNDDDFSANWTATWDDTNLYIHVAVNDNIRKVDSDAWYADDNVEIFLNGNGTRPGAWGAATDFFFLVRPSSTSTSTIEQFRDWKVSPVPAGVEAMTVTVPGTNNYTVEVKIPFSVLGITEQPKAQFIGLEVNVGDDDGDPSVRKMAWRNVANGKPADLSLVQLGGISDTDPQIVPINIVTVTPAADTLEIGEKLSLTKTVSPEAANQSVRWISSNTKVASVNKNGLVSAIGVGTANITVISRQDSTKSATTTIKVVPVYLVDRTNPVNTGVVSAPGADDGTIARNAFDNRPDTKWLHKTNTSWIQFKFSADGAIKYAVHTYTITSANDSETRDPKDWVLYGTNVVNPVFPADFVEVDRQSGVTFASRFEKKEFSTKSNTTAYSTYRLVITANNGAPWTQLAEIELLAPEAAQLVVSPTSAIMEVGQTPQPLSASQDVTWSSSNENVASVSDKGVVTALAIGTSTITATSVADNTKTATVAFTVEKPTFDRTDPVNTGVVSAAGVDDGTVARDAFDNAANTKWLHKANTSWIEYKFSEDGAAKFAVNKYTITSANDEQGRDPKDWTLYGTNVVNPKSLADFVEVDRQSGVTFDNRFEKKEFRIKGNIPEYSMYRLVITANNGAPWTQLAEIELFAPDATQLVVSSTSAILKLGQQPLQLSASQTVTWSSSDENIADVTNKGVVTALKVGTATITATSVVDNTKTATVDITVVTGVFDRTDPVNTGVVSAAGVDDGTTARNAFDNATNTKWLHKANTSWIEYKFSEDGAIKYAVDKYTITSANDVQGRDPKDWILYGTSVTNNPRFPEDFVEVDRQSGVIFAKRFETQEFKAKSNTTAYSTYRLVITANNGADWTQLAEIELFAPIPKIYVTGLTATNVTATGFTLNWSTIGGTVESYDIFRDNAWIGKTMETTFQVESLLPGTTYEMTVEAADIEFGPGAVLTVTTPKSGVVFQEFWANIAGTSVSSIPVDKAPTSVSTITTLEDPTPISNDAQYNNFGQRIRGYIIPSTSATYYFYIAADNSGEFWLSSDDQPANKGTAPIAKTSRATGKREWWLSKSQKSAGIALVAGSKYYFEALMKEGGGGNNLAIGWTTTTNDKSITVIGSSNLEAYVPANGIANVTPSACNNCRTSAEVKEDFTLNLHPNPASSEVNISLAGFAEESAVQVNMIDMNGKRFVSEQVQLRDGIKQVTLPISQLPQGLFLVRVQGSKTTKTAKLVITK